MRTPICERLGCELPIFAFSHCRDVIVEVTKAGGFGVLGAATVSPEQLETELRWIDDHVDGRPYGVDVIIPTTYDQNAERASDDPASLIPQTHRDFLDNILDAEGVPRLPDDERLRIHHDIASGRGNMTPDGARRLVQIALRHPGVRMIVSALGAPPPDIVRIVSYCLRCSGSDSTEYASPISLNRASCPPLESGWWVRASLRYAFLIAAASAPLATPRVA